MWVSKNLRFEYQFNHFLSPIIDNAMDGTQRKATIVSNSIVPDMQIELMVITKAHTNAIYFFAILMFYSETHLNLLQGNKELLMYIRERER